MSGKSKIVMVISAVCVGLTLALLAVSLIIILRSERKTRLTDLFAQELRECLQHHEEFSRLCVAPSTAHYILIYGGINNTDQIEKLRIFVKDKKPPVSVLAQLYVGEIPPTNFFGKDLTWRLESVFDAPPPTNPPGP